jgi:hypothetical protein
MFNTLWPQEYEQQSIRRALSCANCGNPLHILEVHVCELCCAELLSEPNEQMTEEDDG